MPEQQIQPRQTAYKVTIKDLLNNQYIQQEGWNPNYIQIGDKKVSRANIIATIIDKQNSESLSTIILDDGTANIQVKAFNEDARKLTNLEIGNLILVIGRIRMYNNQLFITAEIVRKMDPIWSKVRKLELKKDSISTAQENKITETPIIESTPQTIQEEKVEDINLGENTNRQKILESIKKLETEEGADITEVLNICGLSEQEGEEIINELLEEGSAYTPRPNKIKILN